MSAQLYPSDGEVTKVKNKQTIGKLSLTVEENLQLLVFIQCRRTTLNLPQYGPQIDHAVDEGHTVLYVGENGHRVVARLDLEYKCIYRVQYQDADQQAAVTVQDVPVLL